MATVNAGTTTTVSITANDSVRFDVDPGEVVNVQVFNASGASIFSSPILSTRIIGPFPAGSSMTITAARGNADYEIVDQEQFGSPAMLDSQNRLLDASGAVALDVGAAQALVTGGGSTYVRWCIPGRETSGAFKDVSGRSNDAVVGAGNTAAFAVDGYMGTTAGTSTGDIYLPDAASACDFASDSVLMAFVLRNAHPAASESVASWGAGATGNNPGFAVNHRVTTGFGRIDTNNGGGVAGTTAQSSVAISNVDGTLDVHVALAYDAPTRSLYLYRNGVLIISAAAFMTGANAWGVDTTPNFAARLGRMGHSSNAFAALFKGWQGYVFAGKGLPLNIGSVASRLTDAPGSMLRDYEFFWG